MKKSIRSLSLAVMFVMLAAFAPLIGDKAFTAYAGSQDLIITRQPVNQTINLGESLTVSLEAQGSGLRYQWYCKKDGESEFSLWENATHAAETLTPDVSWDKIQLYCTVTDDADSTVQSDTVRMLVDQELVVGDRYDVSWKYVNLGDPITLTTKATGSDLKYQWYYQKSGDNEARLWYGHTHPTETVTPNETWNYITLYCVVTDRNNHRETSGYTRVVVYLHPLKIVRQPQDQAIELGKPVTISVSVSGTNLRYEWYFKKVGQEDFYRWSKHSSASETVYPNATWDGIQFYCIVRGDQWQAVTSEPCTITLSNIPRITRQPEDQTIDEGDSFTLSVEAERLEPLTYQWCYKKPGGDWTVWEGRTHATETVSSDEIVSGTQFYCRVQGSEGKALNSDTCTVTVRYIEITRQPANVSTKANKAVHLSVEAKGKNLQYQWYYKKKVAYSGVATYYNVWNGFTQPTIHPPANNSWDGMTVKCRITDSDGHSVYTDEATITLLPYEDSEFQIATQPKSVSVEKAGLANQPATFSVKVKNGSGCRYQWYVKHYGETDFSAWDGRTNASETVTLDETWGNTQLYCKITDSDGEELYSDIAWVTITEYITVTRQPADVTVNVGDTAKLSIEAQCLNYNLYYTWYYRKKGQTSFSWWTGGSGNQITVTPDATFDGAQFYCLMNGNGHLVQSDTMTLTVLNPFRITQQPASQWAYGGMMMPLSVKATGNGVKYQWYYKKKGQTSFNVWKGHTRASESVRPNETWDGIQLYCKLTDADGNTLQSSTATINVLFITQNPESRSILLGKPLTLSVKAVGTGLSYQWYYRKPGQSSFSVWKGRTHATETVTPNATWDGIQLYCVVYGNGRTMSCRSSTAMVSVLSIATQPKNQTVTLGNAVTLSVKATGTGISPPWYDLSYQWYYKKKGQTSFNVWNGHTHASETVTPNATWDGIQLYCKVSDRAGNSVDSNAATITIK